MNARDGARQIYNLLEGHIERRKCQCVTVEECYENRLKALTLFVAERDRLKAQRDSLVNHLRAMLGWVDETDIHNASHGPKVSCDYCAARAAIAEAEKS